MLMVITGFRTGTTINAAAWDLAATNPCEEPHYLDLKTNPIDDLSEREYEIFQSRDAACIEWNDR